VKEKYKTTIFLSAVSVLLLALGAVDAKAQSNEITTPEIINLVPELLSDSDSDLGGLPHFKYGIYAALAGSTTPQLYEFDTGGNGFYAVYSTDTNYTQYTQAWGTNFTVVDTNGGSASYTSGNVYSGASVSTSISLYSATGTNPALAPSITTEPVIIGQTASITNANDVPSTLWPSTNPPVPNNFYGDFGLGLASASNSIMNVLAQLNYTNGVIPGFIVSLGTQPQSTNSIPTATLQIGLTASELASYPIKVYLNGSNSTPGNTFANTGLPTYSEAALISSLTLSNAANGSNTFGMPIVIDSGATPAMHYSTNATNLTPYFNDGVNGGGVSDGTTLTLVVTNTDGSTTNLYVVETGGASPNIGVSTTTTNVDVGGLYDLNIGEQLYYQYNVAYDLQDGIIAFQPIVPEPASSGLIVLGGIALSGLILFRRRSLHR
jgi:hypothetical protein